MQLTKVVKVDDARVKALTPDAFRLVLEARGWESVLVYDSQAAWGCGDLFVTESSMGGATAGVLWSMAHMHHHSATFDAFTEVERVQALLNAVQAAERGEWDTVGHATGRAGSWVVSITCEGLVLDAGSLREQLWPNAGRDIRRGPDRRHRAAREARAQLPRLVRIICGVEE